MANAELTIDRAAIRANWQALARIAAPAETAAVVKADAYGLGLCQTARALREAGARSFFTATGDEALALRGILGPEPAIYCLNGLAEDEADALAMAPVYPVLNTPTQLARARACAARLGRPLGCALQLDTGMNRLGLEPDELGALLDAPRSLDGIDLKLLVSHLACADSPEDPMNGAQRAAFEAMAGHPRLAAIPRSLAATGGTLLGAGFHYDMVRPGIGLYGGLPFADARPVATLAVPVLQVRQVAAGESVGYGRGWTAARTTRTATLAAGYADGLIRAMGNRARVFRGDTALPVVGRVSMDLLTVDATDAPDLAEGAMLTLLGPHQGIDALAEAAGTIGYEILTSLGTRYRRRYVG